MTVDAIYRTPAGAAALQSHDKELLAGWPVPHTEDRVATHLGDTFVVASGPAEAPPVILLHGSSANSAMWRADAATWSTTMRVYAVNIPAEPGLSVAARPRSTPTLTSRGSPTCSMLSALTAHPAGISVRPMGPRARHAQGPRRRTLRHGRR
jgi:pimeloyl-ACP methyl ester carboxylesterase